MKGFKTYAAAASLVLASLTLGNPVRVFSQQKELTNKSLSDRCKSMALSLDTNSYVKEFKLNGAPSYSWAYVNSSGKSNPETKWMNTKLWGEVLYLDSANIRAYANFFDTTSLSGDRFFQIATKDLDSLAATLKRDLQFTERLVKDQRLKNEADSAYAHKESQLDSLSSRYNAIVYSPLTKKMKWKQFKSYLNDGLAGLIDLKVAFALWKAEYAAVNSKYGSDSREDRNGKHNWIGTFKDKIDYLGKSIDREILDFNKMNSDPFMCIKHLFW